MGGSNVHELYQAVVFLVLELCAHAVLAVLAVRVISGEQRKRSNAPSIMYLKNVMW